LTAIRLANGEKLDLLKDYHVHCNYNDHSAPDLTVKNAVRYAEKIGLKALAFAEHVRSTSDWIPAYLRDVESISAETDMDILAGFEAKILRDGSVDCPAKYASDYFLIASFHTVYGDKQLWLCALEKAVQNENVDVIGHIAPEATFSLDLEEVKNLAGLIASNGKRVEINAKYKRPPAEWLRVFKKEGVDFHLASDAHALHEIGQFKAVEDLIRIANGS
jgi:putative hydrolase